MSTSLSGINNLKKIKNVPQRKEDVTVVKPVILGTYAFMLTEQEIARRRNRNDNATHRWYCTLRSSTCEDTSYFIRKVVFNLHSSFINPQRTFEKPPYEFNEVGWGEFEIVCKIYFLDPNERPVELRHWLRLYPSDLHTLYPTPTEVNPGACVATEIYDEIYFNSPYEPFYNILMTGPLKPKIQYEMAPNFLKTNNQDKYLASLLSAISTVNQAIEEGTSKATTLTLEINQLKESYYAKHDDKALMIVNKEKQNFS
ncbi:YEATS domain-containing protein 4-like [Hylaeus volcanicus]|uniref:YEATS domain-containing protein 4-like n=1 Tax=Hylaeus volcanicus TaxID=313075 RepID=UPI0023B79214|nr:YEATS domain-containing protein 4-like [Hylaeus volcanicus]